MLINTELFGLIKITIKLCWRELEKNKNVRNSYTMRGSKHSLCLHQRESQTQDLRSKPRQFGSLRLSVVGGAASQESTAALSQRPLAVLDLLNHAQTLL